MESREGMGSTFAFTLRVQEPRGTTRSRSPDQETTEKRPAQALRVTGTKTKPSRKKGENVALLERRTRYLVEEAIDQFTHETQLDLSFIRWKSHSAEALSHGNNTPRLDRSRRQTP